MSKHNSKSRTKPGTYYHDYIQRYNYPCSLKTDSFTRGYGVTCQSLEVISAENKKLLLKKAFIHLYMTEMTLLHVE